MTFRQRCAAIGAVLILAACSGGGGGGTLPGGNNGNGGGSTNPGTPQSYAKQTIHFRVPIKGKAQFRLTALGHHGHPDYVSPATAQIVFVFDSTTNTLSFTSPPATPINLGQGQTLTFESTTAGDYYNVTLSLTALPGQHTVGLTLEDAHNNILSEATQTYTLSPGTNANATMFLNGYIASGFICDWPNCDGTLGTPSTPSNAPGQPPIYTLVAFPADIDGFVIMNQLDSSNNPVPFANGGFTLAENDSNNIVNITNPGPYTTPGTAGNYNNNGPLGGPSGNWYSGWTFTIQCANVGTTTVYMYPTGGGNPLLGLSPGPTGTGFGVPVNCSAGLNLTVE